jgi:hypothetical protein
MAEDEGVEKPLSAWKVFVAFGIIVVVMVGFFWYRSYEAKQLEEENRYNGFDFTPTVAGLWQARIEVGRQPYDIPFYYHPRDLENIPVDSNAVAPVYARPREIYVSLDPDSGSLPAIAGVEISRITGTRYNIFNIDTRGVLSRQPDNKVELPVMNCANATPDKVVIQFIPARQNVIVRSGSNENCVLLNYVTANDSIRVADRYAYMLLKVMQ